MVQWQVARCMMNWWSGMISLSADIGWVVSRRWLDRRGLWSLDRLLGNILNYRNNPCRSNYLLRADGSDGMYYPVSILLYIRRHISWTGNCQARQLSLHSYLVSNSAINWQIYRSRTLHGSVCSWQMPGQVFRRNWHFVWPMAEKSMFWKYKCLTIRHIWMLIRCSRHEAITRRNMLYFGKRTATLGTLGRLQWDYWLLWYVVKNCLRVLRRLNRIRCAIHWLPTNFNYDWPILGAPRWPPFFLSDCRRFLLAVTGRPSPTQNLNNNKWKWKLNPRITWDEINLTKRSG